MTRPAVLHRNNLRREIAALRGSRAGVLVSPAMNASLFLIGIGKVIFGIVVGTLSSIFFANPILLWLGVSKKDLMPVTREDPELARRP